MHSPFILSHLDRPAGRTPSRMPVFVENALLELGQEARGLRLRFDEGSRAVSFVDRSYTEICTLVDWAAGIANKCFGTRQDTEGLVQNECNIAESESREAFFGVLEFWHEFDAVDESPYLDAVRYPSPTGKIVPFTTIGNVSAALGIALLDRLLERQHSRPGDRAVEELGAAWQCAFFAGRSNHFQTLKHLWAV
jgi:hypothetical protein